MIETIHIRQYRKLKDLTLSFSEGLNAIAGSNGTCKTSLLHLFGNSFQAVNRSCEWLREAQCLQIIKAVNAVTNPKVETLTRGDKKYNDPAHGITGELFNVTYGDGVSLAFRRHNSSLTTRYALKPYYKKGSGEKLPKKPVIYLGLSRLVPFGEFHNDDALKRIKNSLPNQYLQEISTLYQQFTHYSVSFKENQLMGDLKTRAEFSSESDGIDSNTISAGEDNLYILLTALVSLKYYYDCITPSSSRRAESVLLVDEVDATLHPAFQVKLLDIMRQFSAMYRIQVVFTTHSMTALENLLDRKDNVIYLLDNVTNVAQMEEPDIYKIKMHLSMQTDEDIYRDKVVPIFTEDEEARFMLDMLLSHFMNTRTEEFCRVNRFFHKVKVCLSADSLRDIFKDSKLLNITMKSICVLDGDKDSDISHYITSLPGKNCNIPSNKMSPEMLLIEYADYLYKIDDSFWLDRTIIDKGFGKRYYLERIKSKNDEYKAAVERGEENTKPRVFNKKLFNENKDFFTLLFKHWLNNPDNSGEINRFYWELKTLFIKVSRYNGINPNEWK